MDISRQELLLVAQQKLEQNQCPAEQQALILRTLDLLLEMAGDDSEETARLFANITDHQNLLVIIQQQANELDALRRITFNLTSSLQMPVILGAIVTEAMHLIKNAHDAHIFLYQDDRLTFGASLDSDGNRDQIFSNPRPDGITYTVARTRQVVMVADMATNELFKNPSENWIGCIIGIPIMLADTVVGVMNMARWSTGGFLESERRLLMLLADQAALAIMNARLHETVANQALSDVLTGLPNRRALDASLEDHIKLAERYDHQFAVIMMDLDGFKYINDTYGHAVGDHILRQFAQFISTTRRSSDFLARYGGDELMMILPETDLATARRASVLILQRMAEFEFLLPDGSKRRLSISGGIALFPSHARTSSDLLRAADEALYFAKRKARGTFQISDADAAEAINPNVHI
ncbi:MAG TPA: sensor domain-containing diguanylate cyclase [Anaerolineales bacterium]|jgi:diguanylate cyclase (GGDEF)-like protein